MKSKLLLLSFFMLLTVATTYAQSSASASGIAIQGIARNINNTAKTNTTIVLNFTIYYGASKIIYNVPKTLVTDAFGVFSTVIDPGVDNNSLIANNQAFLKIEEGTTIISDEQLRHVPYAVSANNGVPTGCIMPFVGTSSQVPVGWLLCNGLINVPNPSALYDLIGGKTPNLGGRFLKGAGTDVETNVQPITLKTTQNQSAPLKVHTHANTLAVVNNNLNTNVPSSVTPWQSTSFQTGPTFTYGPWNIVTNGEGNTNNTRGNTNGNHGHILTGTITGTAIDNNEVRPSSYGVNYIIKL